MHLFLLRNGAGQLTLELSSVNPPSRYTSLALALVRSKPSLYYNLVDLDLQRSEIANNT